jgi:hypothetical protein
MTIWILQILVPVIFFANKVFVLAGQKTGWLVGAVGAVLGLFYFYLIGLYVFTALDLGLIVIMGYGYLKTENNPKVENIIRMVTMVVMILLAGFVFSGSLTIMELVSSASSLMATYYLTHGKNSRGWMLYLVGHVFGAIVGYGRDLNFLADFQVASAIVSLAGLAKEK